MKALLIVALALLALSCKKSSTSVPDNTTVINKESPTSWSFASFDYQFPVNSSTYIYGVVSITDVSSTMVDIEPTFSGSTLNIQFNPGFDAYVLVPMDTLYAYPKRNYMTANCMIGTALRDKGVAEYALDSVQTSITTTVTLDSSSHYHVSWSDPVKLKLISQPQGGIQGADSSYFLVVTDAF
jgi:hypothetical protein